MQSIKITIFTILVFLFSFLGIKIFLDFKLNKDSKTEEIILKETTRVLNECFDLKNKNKRSINKSIELIEYCLKEFGYKR